MRAEPGRIWPEHHQVWPGVNTSWSDVGQIWPTTPKTHLGTLWGSALLEDRPPGAPKISLRNGRATLGSGRKLVPPATMFARKSMLRVPSGSVAPMFVQILFPERTFRSQILDEPRSWLWAAPGRPPPQIDVPSNFPSCPPGRFPKMHPHQLGADWGGSGQFFCRLGQLEPNVGLFR